MAIATRCVDAIIENRSLTEQIWLDATQGRCGSDIVSARGVFAERLWHRAVRAGYQIRDKMLSKDGENATEVMMLKHDFKRTRMLDKLDMSDLTSLEVGEYVQPDLKVDFPAIDSFAVLASVPWGAVKDESDDKVKSVAPAEDAEAQDSIGIMFQMGVSPYKHKSPNASTLRAVDAKMGELASGFTTGKSPLYLVYVTDSADGYRWSNYTKRTKQFTNLRYRRKLLVFSRLPSLSERYRFVVCVTQKGCSSGAQRDSFYTSYASCLLDSSRPSSLDLSEIAMLSCAFKGS